MNGHWRDLEITGLALSPEYVYALAPGGLMPDDKRYGILWLGRKTLEAAYDLEDAFNDVSLALLRGTDEALVIDRLDTLLDRYGGVGAYAREDQLSNWFLTNELEQLRTLSRMLPSNKFEQGYLDDVSPSLGVGVGLALRKLERR